MNCPDGKEWKQQQVNLLNGIFLRQKVSRGCRSRLYSLRVGFLVFIGSVHLMSAPASFADCPWPSWQVVEHADSQTSLVRGVPFTSHYHSWQVPHYEIDQFHCETNIATGPRSWSFQAGPDQDAKVDSSIKIDSSIDASKANTLVKQTEPLARLPELPRRAEQGMEIPRHSELKPLSELPQKALQASPLLPVKPVNALQALPTAQKSLSTLSPLSPLQPQ